MDLWAIDDADLDVYQFRLLCHIARVGICWKSVRTLAEDCKMSIGKVSEVKKWLEENGYIEATVDQKTKNVGYQLSEKYKWQNDTSPKNARYVEKDSSVSASTGEHSGAKIVRLSENSIQQLLESIAINWQKEPSLMDSLVKSADNPAQFIITLSPYHKGEGLASIIYNFFASRATTENIERDGYPCSPDERLQPNRSHSEHQRSHSEHQRSPHEQKTITIRQQQEVAVAQVKQLAQTFTDTSGIFPSRSAWDEEWDLPLKTIYKHSGGDMDTAVSKIEAAVKVARDKGYTIRSPMSITTIVANLNGTHSPTPQVLKVGTR